MFFTLECFSCGMPLGYLYFALELAKVINYSKNYAAVVELLKQVPPDAVDFVLTSVVHFKAYGSNSLAALVE